MFLDTDRLTSLILFQGKKHFGSPLSTQDMFAHQLLMKTRKTTLGTGLKPQHRFFCHINFYSNQVPIWRRIEHLGGNDNKTCLKPSYSLLKPKTPWLILTDKLVVGESDDGNANKALPLLRSPLLNKSQLGSPGLPTCCDGTGELKASTCSWSNKGDVT